MIVKVAGIFLLLFLVIGLFRRVFSSRRSIATETVPGVPAERSARSGRWSRSNLQNPNNPNNPNSLLNPNNPMNPASFRNPNNPANPNNIMRRAQQPPQPPRRRP